MAVLVKDHDRAVAAGAAAALVLPVSAATPDLAEQIAGQLGLAAGSVSRTVLALDGSDYLLFVWKTDRKPDLGGVADLAARLGGELVDGELKPG